jgi:hypothetical protein
MDTPRRWQVASVATAVAGLGLGSLLVGRSPSVEVAPIDLDTALIAAAEARPARDLLLPDPIEIVTPGVREDRIDPVSVPTTTSVASPDPASSTSPRTEQPSRSAPAPTAPTAPLDSNSSSDSVDSVDSVSSVSD